jgi:hypothetical protein
MWDWVIHWICLSENSVFAAVFCPESVRGTLLARMRRRGLKTLDRSGKPREMEARK